MSAVTVLECPPHKTNAIIGSVMGTLLGGGVVFMALSIGDMDIAGYAVLQFVLLLMFLLSFFSTAHAMRFLSYDVVLKTDGDGLFYPILFDSAIPWEKITSVATSHGLFGRSLVIVPNEDIRIPSLTFKKSFQIPMRMLKADYGDLHRAICQYVPENRRLNLSL